MKKFILPGKVLMPDHSYLNNNWKHYSMDFHQHGILELNYIAEGSCSYIVNGISYELKKKNLLVLQSSLPHKKIFNHAIPCTVLGCSFSYQESTIPTASFCSLLEYNPELSAFINDSLGDAYVFPDAHILVPDLQELFMEFTNAKNASYIITLGNKILISMGRLVKKNNLTRREYIAKIQSLIDISYFRIKNVGEIASEVNLNQTYMERIFKLETGCTVWEYVTSIRMQAAVNLLRHPEIRIGDIDSLIGMNSRQAFYLQFKKKFGISPYQYRNSLTENQ